MLEFDQNDASVAGEIWAALATKGLLIGPYDVLIAGQAKARSLTLVTNNVGEFSQVENPRIEDWSWQLWSVILSEQMMSARHSSLGFAHAGSGSVPRSRTSRYLR